MTNDYNKIKDKDKYDALLKSGMFFEFYPELTGNYQLDKLKMISDQILDEMEEELTGYEFIDEYLLDGIIGEGYLDKLKDKNYVVILSTDDNEVCIHTFDTVDQVRTYIQTCYSRPDDSGWFIDRVYDLKDEKELKYNVEVVVTIYN